MMRQAPASPALRRPPARRLRVMVVNAYIDFLWSATPRKVFSVRSMAPAYLAGEFARESVEVKLWDEAFNGQLLDDRLFAWPDLVVLTGLTAAFDRARQLAALFRSLVPGVVTVIGGPIARALPTLCGEVFDHVLDGDVEALGPLIEALYGADARAAEPVPRFDLAGTFAGIGHLETSRYCNFACSFCALTGEGRAYRPYDLGTIERHIAAMGKVRYLALLDNNFYGSNRASFEARTRLLGEHVRRGTFEGWIALVTSDFFRRPGNLELVAGNGCKALFSGVESLDPEVLAAYNKKQNLGSDLETMTRLCAEKGIVFSYGMMLDPAQQTMAEIAADIDGILADPNVPLPVFLSLTIPILGTPQFRASAGAGRLLPGLRLGDMDGKKLIEHPREDFEAVRAFVRDILYLRGRRGALARYAARRFMVQRRDFGLDVRLLGVLQLLTEYVARPEVGSPAQIRQNLRPRSPLTFAATTDGLPPVYRPHRHLEARFAKDFAPLHVTDASGAVTDTVMRDCGGAPPAPLRPATAAAAG